MNTPQNNKRAKNIFEINVFFFIEKAQNNSQKVSVWSVVS